MKALAVNINLCHVTEIGLGSYLLPHHFSVWKEEYTTYYTR